MMCTKVAILTLPLHINFGGNLQAYALQKVLNNLGYSAYLLHIKKPQKTFLEKMVFTGKEVLKKILGRNNFLLTDSEYAFISKNHNFFIDKYIKKTAPIYNLNRLSTVIEAENFDAIIVGSDQVWRSIYTPRIETYFFDFLKDNQKIKRIAYAASFGVDIWDYNEDVTKKIRILAKKFDYIGVRENSGVDLCSKYLDVVADHVLDPTLLLKKEDYLKIIDKNSLKIPKGVFGYILDDNDMKNNMIDTVCSILNLEKNSINLAGATKKDLFTKLTESDVIPSIESWLLSFYNAEFIVTDSFHGMVFSIIFNKPFVILVNEDRGAARFYSLLKQLNLEKRMLNGNEICYQKIENIIGGEINYDEVNLSLSILRENSIKSLTKFLVKK